MHIGILWTMPEALHRFAVTVVGRGPSSLAYAVARIEVNARSGVPERGTAAE
jgi:hypothetical protein